MQINAHKRYNREYYNVLLTVAIIYENMQCIRCIIYYKALLKHKEYFYTTYQNVYSSLLLLCTFLIINITVIKTLNEVQELHYVVNKKVKEKKRKKQLFNIQAEAISKGFEDHEKNKFSYVCPNF